MPYLDDVIAAELPAVPPPITATSQYSLFTIVCILTFLSAINCFYSDCFIHRIPAFRVLAHFKVSNSRGGRIVCRQPIRRTCEFIE